MFKPFRFHDNSVVVVCMDRVQPVYNLYIGSLHYQPNHPPHHSFHRYNCCHHIDRNPDLADHGMASVSTEYLNDERHDMQQNYEKV